MTSYRGNQHQSFVMANNTHFPIENAELYTYEQITTLFGEPSVPLVGGPKGIPEALTSSAAQPDRLAYAFLRLGGPMTNVCPDSPTVLTSANLHLLSPAAKNQAADASFPVFREPSVGRISKGKRVWLCIGWYRVTSVTFLEAHTSELRKLAYADWNQANVDQVGVLRYLKKRTALVSLGKVERRQSPMAGAPIVKASLPSLPPSSASSDAPTSTLVPSSSAGAGASGIDAYIRRLHDEVIRNAPKDLTAAVEYTWGVVAREKAKEGPRIDLDQEKSGGGMGRKLELVTEGWTVKGEGKGKGIGKGRELQLPSGPLAEGKTLLD